MLSELLSEAGYSTGLFGKWHLGDSEERLPIERGFDEWYGLPRTMNEALFTTGTNYDPEVLENPYIMAGKRGAKAQNVKVLDLESRRNQRVTRKELSGIRDQLSMINDKLLNKTTYMELHIVE